LFAGVYAADRDQGQATRRSSSGGRQRLAGAGLKGVSRQAARLAPVGGGEAVGTIQGGAGHDQAVDAVIQRGLDDQGDFVRGQVGGDLEEDRGGIALTRLGETPQQVVQGGAALKRAQARGVG